MLQKNLKRLVSIFLLAALTLIFTGCGGGVKYFYSKTAKEIAAWKPMEIPPDNSPLGSVEMGDTAAIIKADPSGWGGIQSEKMTLDLSKHPMLLIRIRECNDGFAWAAKFVPSEPKKMNTNGASIFSRIMVLSIIIMQVLTSVPNWARMLSRCMVKKLKAYFG